MSSRFHMYTFQKSFIYFSATRLFSNDESNMEQRVFLLIMHIHLSSFNPHVRKARYIYEYDYCQILWFMQHLHCLNKSISNRQVSIVVVLKGIKEKEI